MSLAVIPLAAAAPGRGRGAFDGDPVAMSGATAEDAGLASGLVNTTAQVGGALGLAVLATLSTTRSEGLVDAGHSTASALTSGYHLAFLIGAVLVVAAIVVALIVIEPDEPMEAGAEPALGHA